MIKALRIKLKGTFNSFRDPYFIDYHRTFLFPPKTTLLGLLINAMGLREQDFYELQEKILVGIFIEEILGKGFDLWKVRKGKVAEEIETHIPSIVHREFLIYPTYIIYISAEDDLLDEIEISLNNPKRYYSLGRDNELVKISEVKKIILIRSKQKEFSCVLPFDIYAEDIYEIKILDNFIIRPEIVKMPLKIRKGKKGRIGEDITNFTQFYGLKVVFKKEVKCFIDKEEKKNIIFF